MLVAEGVPVMAPEADVILKPAGSDGEMLKTRLPVPPVAVTGVKLAAELCVSVLVATDCEAATAAFTVRLKVAVEVALLVSVTVTV